MKISITLPSIYPESLERCLNNIKDNTYYKYEVIVVSPFALKLKNVIWIEETERRGCAFAHHVAAERSTGKFLTAFADDFTYRKNWDKFAVDDLLSRERHWPDNYVLGLRFEHQQHIGTNFGIYYPYFPFMRRSNLASCGWIGREYRYGFGDSDFGMRVWDAGGRCEFSREGLISPTPDDDRKGSAIQYSQEDIKLFVNRWSSKYGNLWNTEDIRQFNSDISLNQYPTVMDQRTIFYNKPDLYQALASGSNTDEAREIAMSSQQKENLFRRLTSSARRNFRKRADV